MGRKSTLAYLGVQQIFYYWREDIPFLREGLAHVMYQYQPMLHNHNVLALPRTLVPRRKSRTEELLGVTQRGELLHHCRRHLRAAVRSHNARDPAGSHDTRNQSCKKLFLAKPNERLDLANAQESAMVTHSITIPLCTPSERALTINDDITPRQLLELIKRS